MNVDLGENNIQVNLEDKKINLDFGTQKINSGTKYHNELINLDFENSGHKGFASAEDINKLNEELLNYVKDENYNHTDNNFTDEDKEKLDNLQNFSGDAKDVKFEDGETFQEKYNSGELKGDKGDKGDVGPQGATGKNGQDGYTPIKGIDYFDGQDGKNGTNGTDGKDGKDGINGIDGKDGVSATHSWNGTVLTITSASGTSSADLKGEKGEPSAPLTATNTSYEDNLGNGVNNVQDGLDEAFHIMEYMQENIDELGVKHLGTIPLGDYDDSAFVFIETLTEEGRYKFIDDSDEFVWYVEVVRLGDNQLGQLYTNTEESYDAQYFRSGHNNGGGWQFSDWKFYITNSSAQSLFAPKNHNHYKTHSTNKDIRTFLENFVDTSVPVHKVKDYVNNRLYIVKTEDDNYNLGGALKNIRYQEYYWIEEPQKIYKRSGIYKSGKITWNDWCTFLDSESMVELVLNSIPSSEEVSY